LLTDREHGRRPAKVVTLVASSGMRDDIERRVHQLIDELGLTPAVIEAWGAGSTHLNCPTPKLAFG
jgi:hypothetical protein